MARILFPVFAFARPEQSDESGCWMVEASTAGEDFVHGAISWVCRGAVERVFFSSHSPGTSLKTWFGKGKLRRHQERQCRCPCPEGSAMSTLSCYSHVNLSLGFKGTTMDERWFLMIFVIFKFIARYRFKNTEVSDKVVASTWRSGPRPRVCVASNLHPAGVKDANKNAMVKSNERQFHSTSDTLVMMLFTSFYSPMVLWILTITGSLKDEIRFGSFSDDRLRHTRPHTRSNHTLHLEHHTPEYQRWANLGTQNGHVALLHVDMGHVSLWLLCPSNRR